MMDDYGGLKIFGYNYDITSVPLNMLHKWEKKYKKLDRFKHCRNFSQHAQLEVLTGSSSPEHEGIDPELEDSDNSKAIFPLRDYYI